jgi:competence protein ComEC
MPEAAPPIPATARLLFAVLPGFVAGAALQLQQGELSAPWVYACFVLVAFVLYAIAAIKRIAYPWRLMFTLVASALLAVALTGARSTLFLGAALDPALEGRDVELIGVVTAMPERNEAGTRFRLSVEQARRGGQAMRVPPLLDVAWYNGVGVGPMGTVAPVLELQRQSADIRAGERWQMTVRLKAPHGASNPFGFDYELWLWEQGVQATGYVRAGPRDPVPQRLAQTWSHPVETFRQGVRDAIVERVADRRYAGLIAALVVGDQNAIERGFGH